MGGRPWGGKPQPKQKPEPKLSIEGSYDNVNDASSSTLGNLGADLRWRLDFQ